MGFYINPKDQTKEAWLASHGKLTSKSLIDYDQVRTDKLVPVCLIDNGAFTAAGIAFDAGEFEAFDQPHDRRPKVWYLVPEDKVVEMVPAVGNIL